MKYPRFRDDVSTPGAPHDRRRWRGARREDPTHRPHLEPAHDQPWVPRSAFTDRLRRSPRR